MTESALETVWGGTLSEAYSACLRCPDEDTPRLAFADALLEFANGADADMMRAWAAFIQLQVATELRACDRCRESLREERLFIPANSPSGTVRPPRHLAEFRLSCRCRAEHGRLQAARDAMLRYRCLIGGQITTLPLRVWIGRSLPAVPIRRVEFARGMIDSVTLTLSSFLIGYRTIAEFHPVVYYRLYDHHPLRDEGYSLTGWEVGKPPPHHYPVAGLRQHILPAELYLEVLDQMGRYGIDRVYSVSLANLFLVRAALAVARRSVGLPTLDPTNLIPLPR